MVKREKIAVLSLIRDNKSLLFGKSNDYFTNKKKEEAWKEVVQLAKCLGLLSATKDWQYLRNTTWQNWKRRTLDKVDRSNTTTGDESAWNYCSFDEFDNLVLEILGMESPIIEGPNNNPPETLSDTSVPYQGPKLNIHVDSHEAPLLKIQVPDTQNEPPEKIPKLVFMEEELKKNLLYEEIKALQLDNIKRELDIHLRHIEVIKISKENNLPLSSITKTYFNM